MKFQSILFEQAEDGAGKDEPPVIFADLNLGPIVNAATAGRDEYNLKPYFYCALHRREAVEYRHEIMQDLENVQLSESVKSFAQKMRTMTQYLAQAQKLFHKHQKEAWFLDAVEIYCDAVYSFAQDLATENLRSRGMRAWREYLTSYAKSPHFLSLQAGTKKIKVDLSEITYCVLIKGGSIRVRKYASEADYGTEVEQTFAKFKQGVADEYATKFSSSLSMNQLEEKILDYVAQLYPDPFRNLDVYCADNLDYPDDTIAVFDREIQFYIAWLEYTARLRDSGLNFCYPQITNTLKHVHDYEGFDLALADNLTHEHAQVVCNDFYLEGQERVIVVTGPNQGGKSTFARMFGQLHYLASLGCTVPGREAQLLLCDGLFTHFERAENIVDLRGKLQDDLLRVHEILDRATSHSIIIMNEILTSTTLQDAVFLSRRIMEKIVALDALCVWVTFIDEIASFSKQTVSMVSGVVPGNLAQRTYKLTRKPADGLAYAMAIVEKYRLTYACIKERVKT